MRKLLDIEESHHNQYVPKNMVLILTGNYPDANDIIELFSDKENHGSINRRLSVETASPKKIKRLKKSGINQFFSSGKQNLFEKE